MIIKVAHVIGSNRAVSSANGKVLFKVLLDNFFQIKTIDFSNIEYLSSAFLNESIGRIVLTKNNNLDSIKFEYPEDDFLFKNKVINIIQNSLLGDTYDSMINKAAASL